MEFVENVFPHLARFMDEGASVALVTLINIEGSSPRPVGAMIGVASDGRAVGMITGGCAEKAIAEEARQCIKERANKSIRYGAGSPYVDVVLPCGSGIDLFVLTDGVEAIVHEVMNIHAERKPAFIAIDTSTNTARASAIELEKNAPGVAVTRCDPDFRIFAFGEGANIVSFSTIAQRAGYEVTAFSPDAETLAFLSQAGVAGQSIHLDADFTAIEADRFTAIVTLFHEHEWEAPILHAALNSPAAYIGALGSRKTHQARLDALGALAQTQRPLSDIHGPVGLDIGAANPNEIAVSILAEITKSRRRR